MMWKWQGPNVGGAAARVQVQKLPMLAALGLRFLPVWHCSEVSVAELSHSPDWSGHSLPLRCPGLCTRELGVVQAPGPAL